MKPLPVPYRSNPGPFKIMGSPKVVNAYAEAGGKDNKADFSLLPVAGIKTFGTENGSGTRGMLYLEDDRLIIAIQGSQSFKVEENGTFTRIGFIAGEKPPFMARNDADPQQVVIVSEQKVYEITDGVQSIKKYTSTTIDENDVETVEDLVFDGVTYVGGYFVFWQSSGRFYVSELQSTVVNDLQFATAEGDPDGLVIAHGTANTLYLFGPKSTEIWVISGADFPLQRMAGAYFRFGTNSPHTVKDFDNGIALVGSDNVVYKIEGVNYKPISSNEVSRLIEAEEDKSAIVAFTHQRGQNKFYCLQGTGWTREYNSATGAWHNREDVLGNQWHCVHHARAWNRDIYGDRITGQLFEGDYTLFEDNGQQLAWGFVTSIFHDAPNGLSFDRTELDMETGDGVSKSVDAKVMFRWSKDNGRTWAERQLSLGKTGEYRKRVRTGPIGQCDAKGMMIGVWVTDPIVRAIAGIYSDVKRVTL